MVLILLVSAGRLGSASAQTVTTLYSFAAYPPMDGVGPSGSLVQGSDGNFYGTTFSGGLSGDGTIFRISSGGSFSNLYTFGPFPPNGPYGPRAGLVQGSDGNFYGTTTGGGMHNEGVVFRISPSGSETDLYSFVGYPSDGEIPDAGLIQGSDGNFYGTCNGGGSNNDGTVFRISPSGSETNLYSFVGYPGDGQVPVGGLVQGSDGNFYGTTYQGGTNACRCGTVFWISPSGTETTLYSFANSPDGSEPTASLVQGSDGNFYGTTEYGGANNKGTVFRVSPSGSETNLHSFEGPPNDGKNPNAGLVQASDGNFYGICIGGGSNSDGTVFRISPSGSYSNLCSFVGPPDGASPYAGLVQGSDGNFYGTTSAGGTSTNCDGGCGTVFKLTVLLNPPANQISTIQLAGTNVVLAIPSIAGETYQLQLRSSFASGNWSNVPGASVTNSIGALMTLTNTAGASAQQFYRFVITP